MPKLLWEPSEECIKKSNMYRFMTYINHRFQMDFKEYPSLYQWSVRNIPEFWAALWDFVDVLVSHPYDQVLENETRFPGAKWFLGARLNFAENLLRYRDDHTALIFRGEDSVRREMTYRELYGEVVRVAGALRKTGVLAGDRVAAYMPNMPETVIAMLAATSIGAIWSSCSPDFGIKGVLDRFGQTKPKVLFTADGYWFKGKRLNSLGRVDEIKNALSAIEKIVVVPYTEKNPDIQDIPGAIAYEDFKTSNGTTRIEFEQLPFDHPLYIMYSSGTTGLPKCMVQGAGGILLNHLKELMLHTDVKREDRIFYFTTCGWMMWNWLISSLALGATVVLMDGSPFHPAPDALWKMAQEERLTVLGISAGYIDAIRNEGLCPGKDFNLSTLRAILSTGSPLSEQCFEYVYRKIKGNVQLSSISGGSDINGCFLAGNPMGPVYAGELQCRGLGMKIEAFNEQGKPVVNQQGELVCTAPAPSMPIYFWDDTTGEKYMDAYFRVYPQVWRHGDFININERGGVVIYGRSDATLNPGGVRIGTAEIYRQVDQVREIEDSLVVGQEKNNDVRVILFVKLVAGAELTEALILKIKTQIRENASPRHVPAKIIAVPEIPYTLNMKKVELAVKKVIEGKPVLNKDALMNPESLKYFENLPELLAS